MPITQVVHNNHRNHIRRLHDVTKDVDDRIANEDRRKVAGVSVETIKLQLENDRHEYGVLWDQVDRRDKQRILMIRTALGIFSIFASGLIAIFVVANKINSVIEATPEFIALFSLVLIGMGASNIAIIRHIISFQHARILLVRQINCLRHRMDACSYAMVEGIFPHSPSEITKEDGCPDTTYYQIFGKHRKLPVDNKWLTSVHRNLFESPDTITVSVIAILTGVLFLLPPIYFVITTNNAVSGAISVLLGGIFAFSLYLIMRSAKKGIDYAISLNQHSPNDN